MGKTKCFFFNLVLNNNHQITQLCQFDCCLFDYNLILNLCLTIHESQFSIFGWRNFFNMSQWVIQINIFGENNFVLKNYFSLFFFFLIRCIQDLNCFTQKVILTFLQLFKKVDAYETFSSFWGKTQGASFKIRKERMTEKEWYKNCPFHPHI